MLSVPSRHCRVVSSYIVWGRFVMPSTRAHCNPWSQTTMQLQIPLGRQLRWCFLRVAWGTESESRKPTFTAPWEPRLVARALHRTTRSIAHRSTRTPCRLDLRIDVCRGCACRKSCFRCSEACRSQNSCACGLASSL